MSRSGGMTTEISSTLTAAGLGVSTACSIGGDAIIGSTYAELMPLFEADEQTEAIVIYTEPGGRMEAELAQLRDREQLDACRSSRSWPAASWTRCRACRFGHAGTIVEGKADTAAEKIKRLNDAGITVAEEISEIPDLVKAEARGEGGLMSGLFIDVEVDESIRDDAELAQKLEDACPVDIFANDERAREGRRGQPRRVRALRAVRQGGAARHRQGDQALRRVRPAGLGPLVDTDVVRRALVTALFAAAGSPGARLGGAAAAGSVRGDAVLARRRGDRHARGQRATTWASARPSTTSAAGPLRIEGTRSSVDVPQMDATQVIENTSGRDTRRAGIGKLEYVDSITHRHWHYLRFNTYALRSVDGTLALPDQKTGFCLGDRVLAHDFETLPGQPRGPVFNGGCGYDAPELLKVSEGISPNYADPYDPQVEGQFIDITGVPAGRYQLVHHVNADRSLRESDYSNNAGVGAARRVVAAGRERRAEARPAGALPRERHVPGPAPAHEGACRVTRARRLPPRLQRPLATGRVRRAAPGRAHAARVPGAAAAAR